MEDILNVSQVGINKNKNKNNNKNKEESKNDGPKDIHFTVRISHEEGRYYSTMISILYNLRVNGRPVLRRMGLSSFCKMALNYFYNNFRDNVFSDNHVVDKIDINDMDTFAKFLDFRVKYMNYPLDKQIEDFLLCSLQVHLVRLYSFFSQSIHLLSLEQLSSQLIT